MVVNILMVFRFISVITLYLIQVNFQNWLSIVDDRKGSTSINTLTKFSLHVIFYHVVLIYLNTTQINPLRLNYTLIAVSEQMLSLVISSIMLEKHGWVNQEEELRNIIKSSCFKYVFLKGSVLKLVLELLFLLSSKIKTE